jgi:hypothetical protein
MPFYILKEFNRYLIIRRFIAIVQPLYAIKGKVEILELKSRDAQVELNQ